MYKVFESKDKLEQFFMKHGLFEQVWQQKKTNFSILLPRCKVVKSNSHRFVANVSVGRKRRIKVIGTEIDDSTTGIEFKCGRFTPMFVWGLITLPIGLGVILIIMAFWTRNASKTYAVKTILPIVYEYFPKNENPVMTKKLIEKGQSPKVTVEIQEKADLKNVDNENGGKEADSVNLNSYNIVFYGEVQKNQDSVYVRGRFQDLFKLSDQKLDMLFSNSRTLLKKNIDESAAIRLHEKFSRLGAVCRIEMALDEGE